MVGHMVAVGEETGQLEHMLSKIADFYEAEVDAKVKALTALIEPLMIVFVGGMVGFIVISMYLPIFSLYEQDPLSRLLSSSPAPYRFRTCGSHRNPDFSADEVQISGIKSVGPLSMRPCVMNLPVPRCKRQTRREAGAQSRRDSLWSQPGYHRGRQTPRGFTRRGSGAND